MSENQAVYTDQPFDNIQYEVPQEIQIKRIPVVDLVHINLAHYHKPEYEYEVDFLFFDRIEVGFLFTVMEMRVILGVTSSLCKFLEKSLKWISYSMTMKDMGPVILVLTISNYFEI